MRKRNVTNFIVVHCAATQATADIGAATIRKWHTDPKPDGRGWRDIGYHAVIRRNGKIEYGRHFDEPGAQVAGHNYESIGICLVGGIDANGDAEMNFTASQMGSLRALLLVLTISYPDAEILGHRDMSPDADGDGVVEEHEWLKDCPSFDVRAWLRGEPI